MVFPRASILIIFAILLAFPLSISAVPAVGCGALSANGTYTLNESINISGATCLNVTAENVTIDCAGFSITGDNSSTTYGIYTDQFNTTIRNCTIMDFDPGIYLDGATYGTMRDNTIISNAGDGITFHAASNNTLSGLNVSSLFNPSSTPDNAIVLETGSAGNALSNFNATSTDVAGIYITGSSDGNAFNNFTIHAQDYGIRIDSAINNTFSNFTCEAYMSGIDLAYDQGSLFSDFNVTTTLSGISDTLGQGGTVFERFNVTSLSDVAIQITTTTGDTFTDFNATAATTGLMIGQPFGNSINSNITISNANISTTSVSNSALWIRGSTTYSTISNSTFRSDVSGGYVAEFTSVTTGMWPRTITYSPMFNALVNNTFISGTGSDTLLYIDAGGGFFSSMQNTFYWNNFTATTGTLVLDSNGGNYWNSTASGTNEGNFWGDVLDGTLGITGYSESLHFPGYYIGDGGADYPYGPTSVRVSGLTDYAPLTPYQPTTCACGTITESCVLYSNISSPGSDCFAIAASGVAIDCHGFSVMGNDAPNMIGFYSDQDGTTIQNCAISGFGNGVYFDGAASGIVKNNAMNNTGEDIYLVHASANLFANNTLASETRASSLMYIDSGSSGNTFYWNNFTDTSGLYVDDEGANYYNATTPSATNEGNIWADVMDGSLNITGHTLSTGFSPLFIGANGTDYPYSSAKVSGVTDSYPLTPEFTGCECGVPITAPNVVCNLTENVSINGATCFDIQASNVTIECNGYSIEGDNSFSYGVSSNQPFTIVRNCIISYFHAGIYFSGATNGTVQNVSINTTDAAGTGMNIMSSQYNTFSNVDVTAYNGAIVLSSSDNNTISNTNTVAGDAMAIFFYASDHNLITNTTATALYSVVDIDPDSDWNIFANMTATATSGDNAFYLGLNCNNNTFANSTAIANGYAIALLTSSDNVISNNTLKSSSGTSSLAVINSGSSGNTFYWNNFTNTSGLYVNDIDGGNYFNATTPSATNEGNIWADVMDGSVNITSNPRASSGYGAGWSVGNNGTGYPYDENSTAKVTSGVADYAPLKPAPAPANATINSITNASAGHSFLLNASVNDADGGTDIVATNISTTLGNCTYLSNNTLGMTFTAIFNCTSTLPGTANVSVGFTNAFALYNNTSTASNTYPDNAPAITKPVITPNSPAYTTNTLTCNPQAFSDIDSDTENTSSRAWIWYRNGNAISGQTGQTLAPASFVLGDLISCQETVFANNWTAYNATNISSNVTITTPSSGGSNTGGGSSTYPTSTPVLSTSFNCSTGAFEVIAKTPGGTPISALGIHLQETNTTATTDSSGTAHFYITQDGTYTVRTLSTSSYSVASATYSLAMCLPVPETNITNITQPNATTNVSGNQTPPYVPPTPPQQPTTPTLPVPTEVAPASQAGFLDLIFNTIAGLFGYGASGQAAQPGTTAGTAQQEGSILPLLFMLGAIVALAMLLYLYLRGRMSRKKK